MYVLLFVLLLVCFVIVVWYALLVLLLNVCWVWVCGDVDMSLFGNGLIFATIDDCKFWFGDWCCLCVLWFD